MQNNVQKISLPYPYKGKNERNYSILGWHRSEIKRLVIQEMAGPASSSTFVLTHQESMELLEKLKISIEQMPDNTWLKEYPKDLKVPSPEGVRVLKIDSKKVHPSRPQPSDDISKEEWERYQRFKEAFGSIKESMTEVLSNWKHFKRYIRDEFSYNDFKKMSEVDEPLETLLCYIKFVKTGNFPTKKRRQPEIDDDDDDGDYDPEDAYVPYYMHQAPAKKKEVVAKQVLVELEDVSDGKL